MKASLGFSVSETVSSSTSMSRERIDKCSGESTNKSILKFANHVSLDERVFKTSDYFVQHILFQRLGIDPLLVPSLTSSRLTRLLTKKTPNSSLGLVMYSVHAHPFRCALHVVTVVIHVRPSVRPWCPRSFYRHQGRGST